MKDYSNYHHTNVNDKIIADGHIVFDKMLNSFNGCDLLINSAPAKAVITSKFTSNDNSQKNIYTRSGTIHIGDNIEYNDQFWLVIAYPEDNKIYEHSIIQLCNNTLRLPTPDEQIFTGKYDEMMNPVFTTVSHDPFTCPCIIEDVNSSLSKSYNPVSLKSGTIILTIGFTTSPNITIGREFDFLNNRYQIYDLDYQDTIGNSKGLIHILSNQIAQGGDA